MNFGSTTRIKTAAGTAPIPVPSATTVYTPVFELYGGEAFGVGLLANAGVAANIDVKVELEETMQESSDITSETSDTDMVVPDGFPTVANLKDNVLHIKQITPIPAKLGRFKLTGQNSNPADTTVRIDLFRQEWLG